MFFRYVCMEAAGNFREAPRAGHVIVALERNYFYICKATSKLQLLYPKKKLYIYDCRFISIVEGVWSKVVAMAEGCLQDPQRLVLHSLFGDCNKNLDPLDDIYYYTQ
ncbi:hypothetical protein IGI04_034590, partial [Brassica rapa subsp. trilocularis]